MNWSLESQPYRWWIIRYIFHCCISHFWPRTRECTRMAGSFFVSHHRIGYKGSSMDDSLKGVRGLFVLCRRSHRSWESWVPCVMFREFPETFLKALELFPIQCKFSSFWIGPRGSDCATFFCGTRWTGHLVVSRCWGLRVVRHRWLDGMHPELQYVMPHFRYRHFV